jgi:hypothetical protein
LIHETEQAGAIPACFFTGLNETARQRSLAEPVAQGDL